MTEENAYDAETLGTIRQITDAAGKQAVPFLDDAVKAIVAERDDAWEAIGDLVGRIHRLPAEHRAHVLGDAVPSDPRIVCCACRQPLDSPGCTMNGAGKPYHHAGARGRSDGELRLLVDLLVDPDKALELVSAEERAEFERCRDSIIEARRAGERTARDLWIG